MFEAKYGVTTEAWYVSERIDGKSRYLCKDGEVRGWASGNTEDNASGAAIVDNLQSAYYPTREAALAAIGMYYASDERHYDDTETIEPGDIAATLREEGE
jgi:hypothetical protein